MATASDDEAIKAITNPFKQQLVWTDGKGSVYILDPDHPSAPDNIRRMGRLGREVLKAHLSANIDLMMEIMYPVEEIK